MCVCVCVCLQGDSREVVAVKVVSKKSLNKASMENLLTEIEILKTVRHPHIVQLKDFQVDHWSKLFWENKLIYTSKTIAEKQL